MMTKEQKREYQKQYMANKRSNKEGLTEPENVRPIEDVRPEPVRPILPDNYGQPDCQCWHCKQNSSQPKDRQVIINHGPYKTADQLAAGEVNRQALPGDIDYQGAVCK